MPTQKIIPHLWFENEAKEAAHFYVSAFGGDSEIISETVLKDTPSGDCDVMRFRLLDHEFMSINAGPLFKLNPAISFFVNFDPASDSEAKANLQSLWDKLAEGGKVLMDLAEYPFSKYYGWIEDKYGVSWQLILTDPDGDPRPAIVPSLLFTGEMMGKAEAAMDFYLSVFKNSKAGIKANYEEGQSENKNAKLMYADFMIENYWIAIMDDNAGSDFGFNEAVSLIVSCKDQAEIDYYWEKLSAVPESEQCGWLKDKYGVSWQIVPESMNQMMEQGSPEQIARVTEAFLKMQKFDLKTLEEAYQDK